MKTKTRTRIRRAGRSASVVLGLAAVVASAQVKIPVQDPAAHDVRPAPGFKTRMLSEYLPGLARTPGDSAVFILEGPVPGGTVFVAGGTHANEIAGIMAALLLVEQAKVEKGRLIVVPYANNSAITYRDPDRPGVAANFILKTPSGERTFPIGARLTKPEDQGEPDPPDAKAPSPEYPAGNVSRNLDRQYPGRPEGNLTQRIAGAIVALLKKENADLAFDLHEAPPESRLAMMIVANPKNSDLAAEAVLDLEARGLTMRIEESSSTFRGLSHREWGDATPAKAFLFETPNPGSRRESPGDPVTDREWPLAKRVGVHLEALRSVVEAYNAAVSEPGRVKITNLPAAADLLKTGLGPYLR
jgi:hypothetical protein